MWNENRLPKPQKLSTWQDEMDTMSHHIMRKALSSNGKLNILEAGCGNMTGLSLDGIQYTITGVDIDKDALDIRNTQERSLDISIIGDLRDVKIEENRFDVIYNSYVLEHIDGAEGVLSNFVRWLKPGGILVLRIPNRDSVRGFLTRITPFWFHVFYAKHMQGYKDAGKPGFAPYPTYYDKVVSRRGIYEFCTMYGIKVKAEYSGGHGRKNRQISVIADKMADWILHAATLNLLFSKHTILIYSIEKSSNAG